MRIKKGFAYTSLEGPKSCCDVDRCSEPWTLLRPTHTQVPLLVTRNPKLLSTLKTGPSQEASQAVPMSATLEQSLCKGLMQSFDSSTSHSWARRGLALSFIVRSCQLTPRALQEKI